MTRRATWLVAALTAASIALLVVAWTYAFFNHDNPLTSPFGPDLVVEAGILPVGVIVAIRQPRNPIGWLFLASSVLGALHAAAGEYAWHGLLAAPSEPGLLIAAWISNWIVSLVFPAGTFFFVLLLFPNGRLLGSRWRIAAGAAVVFTALPIIGAIFASWPIAIAPNVRTIPNPTAIAGFDSLFGWIWVTWPAGVLLLLVAGAGMVLRYRRSAGDERQQIKWFAFAVTATLAGYVASFPFSLSSSFNAAVGNAVIELGIGVGLPVTCAIAILKYRLYGIDVVISRTLVYAALAALITGVYVGIAVGFGTLVGSGGKPNLGLSILATALVAVGFQPVRQRLQRVANRLVYGRRATPYQVLSEFSGRVAETYGADEVLPRMARVLQEGTGAAAATVWLRAGDQLRPAATHPPSSNGLEPLPLSGDELPAIEGADFAVPVLHQGDLLGALAIVKRRGETLTPIEQELLDDLAHQAGLVLKNVRLTAELMERLDELRASRQRLVTAQDEERRRLERNLHDGAQQHLVALKVKLGLAQLLLKKDPDKVGVTLHQLEDDANEALETLRDLARGIYPPILADKGLAAALESQARKATVPVDVRAGELRRYPQAQEAAVYFCVLEALQNVQKYAGASRVTLQVQEADSVLRFAVEDDGRGFDMATVHLGSGLTNLADRLDALGGRLEIVSSPGRGCQVHGTLPVNQPPTAAADGLGAVARPTLEVVPVG